MRKSRVEIPQMVDLQLRPGWKRPIQTDREKEREELRKESNGAEIAERGTCHMRRSRLGSV